MKFKIIFTVVIIMATLTHAGQIIKNIYLEKLDNGVTAIIKERKDTQAVAIQVWFGVGSVFEKDNERGLSHFLEHMLFNGTKYTKPGEIEFEIEKKGGSINAATSTDFTYYHIEIAAPFWEESLQYLYYMTTAPTLSEDMIKKEKPIVLEELNRHLDNPKSLLWDTYNKLAYKVSNYKHPVIGYRETIQKFNQELVRNYFYSHYVPSNTYVVVVGNIDRDSVLKKIKETFGTAKGKHYRPPKVPLEPPQKEIRKKIIRKPQVTRAYVAIGWQAPPISDKESFTANVLEEIFTGGRTSVLYQKLREKGLVQAIYGGYLSHRGTSQFLFYFVTDVDKIEKVKNELFKVIKDFKENGVPEDLVKDAKKKIINSEIFAREEVTHDAEALGYAASVAEDIYYDIKYTENIEKVSKKDIDEYIKKYFGENNYTEVQLLPESP
ncbi:Predicted Zn-dependent peptidase [Persephonella hydrogeniphila]|uniref:Predicted Zn-dependent peptidase n=1 Tax=Persephonella hydrogeniphila TaxID=198703 RepID=A0A285NP56_9AQUI|nr:pitrilysin family protein [Persephonella hydrogeniphila]SNZ09421.1 Predicted Zn-dependent peptidase [Persephonella hydrogeniphila]